MNFMVEIAPLKGKHYSTNVEADIGNFENIVVEIYGQNRKPSQREIDNGWEPDDGMEHVEGDKVYEVALRIIGLLKDMYG
jgi:hypothetical protein